MPDDPPNDDKNVWNVAGLKVRKEISITVLGYLAVTLVTFLWLTFGYLVKINQNEEDYTKFKTETNQKIADMRAEYNKRVTDIRADLLEKQNDQQRMQAAQTAEIQRLIAVLPDMRATVTQLEHRLDQADNRGAAQSVRLDSVQTMGIQTSSDVTALLRSLAGNPRPGPVR